MYCYVWYAKYTLKEVSCIFSHVRTCFFSDNFTQSCL